MGLAIAREKGKEEEENKPNYKYMFLKTLTQ